jgi:hypothetical protein
MKQLRPSLEAIAGGVVPKLATDPEPVEAVAPPPPVRRGVLHTSIYIDKRVQRVIREIAFVYDLRPHDIYLEGIDLVLKRYGRPSIAEIAGNAGRGSDG